MAARVEPSQPAVAGRRYLRTVFRDIPSSMLIARMLFPWRLKTGISTYPSSRNMPEDKLQSLHKGWVKFQSATWVNLRPAATLVC